MFQLHERLLKPIRTVVYMYDYLWDLCYINIPETCASIIQFNSTGYNQYIKCCMWQWLHVNYSNYFKRYLIVSIRIETLQQKVIQQHQYVMYKSQWQSIIEQNNCTFVFQFGYRYHYQLFYFGFNKRSCNWNNDTYQS